MKTHDVTFSIGVAETGPDNYMVMDELVTIADEAMYQAKAASRIELGHKIRHRQNQTTG